jgi:hypothetical protein
MRLCIGLSRGFSDATEDQLNGAGSVSNQGLILSLFCAEMPQES